MKINPKRSIRYFSIVLLVFNAITIFTCFYNSFLSQSTFFDFFLEIAWLTTFFGNVSSIVICYLFLNFKKSKRAGMIHRFYSVHLITFFLLIPVVVLKIVTTVLIQDLSHVYHGLFTSLLLILNTFTFLFSTVAAYLMFKSTIGTTEAGDRLKAEIWGSKGPVIDQKTLPLKLNISTIVKAFGFTSIMAFFVFAVLIESIFLTGKPVPVDMGQISPYMFILTAILMLSGIRLVSRSKSKGNRVFLLIFIITCGTITVINAVPSISINGTISSLNSQFSNAFGVSWKADIPPGQRVGFRNAPYLLKDALYPVPLPEVDEVLDIHYTYTNGTSFKFDWYGPKGINDTTNVLPVIIAIHGGGWMYNDKGVMNLVPVHRYIAHKGYIVVDVAYGHYREDGLGYTWKDMIKQIGNLTKFLDTNAAEFHVNISQTYFLGRSSGGHLALVSGLGYNYDYYANTTTFSSNLNCLGIIPIYSPTNMSYKGTELAGVSEANFSYYNPIDLVNTSSPPVFLVQGDIDRIVHPRHATQFQGAMATHGSICITAMMPYGGHIFDAIYTSLYVQVYLYYIERFLILSRL